MLSFLISGALVLVVVALIAYYYYPKGDKDLKIPGLDPPDKVEGNLPDIQKAGGVTDFLVDLHNRFGHIASFWYGPVYTVSITSPELFKETAHLFDRPEMLFASVKPLMGQGSIQYGCGPEAQNRRKIQDRAFSHTAVARRISLFQQVGEELTEELTQMSAKGEHIPLSVHIYNAVLKILSIFAFGDYFKDEKALLSFKKGYDESFRILADTTVDGPIEPGSEKEKKLLDAKNHMHSVILDLMKQREEMEIDPDDKLLIDLLMDSYDNEDQLFSDLLTFIIAGYHTTSTTLIWAFYFLAKNPDMQDRCFEEITSVWKSDSLTWEVIKDVKYIRQVLNETMRITRTGAFAARFSDQDLVLGGYKVPKNTPIIQSVGITMGDKTFFDEPEKFDPDRFSEERKPKSFVFEPFGFAGKRKCPGYRLSEMETASILCVLLRKLKLKLVPDQDIKFLFEFATQPNQEIWITAEPRHNAEIVEE